LLSLVVPITILSYPTTAVGGKVLYKFADEKEKEMHRGREMKVMVNMLSQYKKMCGTRKVMLFILIFELLQINRPHQIMQCLFVVIW
jgi:hypothetical protein